MLIFLLESSIPGALASIYPPNNPVRYGTGGLKPRWWTGWLGGTRKVEKTRPGEEKEWTRDGKRLAEGWALVGRQPSESRKIRKDPEVVNTLPSSTVRSRVGRRQQLGGGQPASPTSNTTPYRQGLQWQASNKSPHSGYLTPGPKSDIQRRLQSYFPLSYGLWCWFLETLANPRELRILRDE